ncbi:DUF7575 domain-containing protein [Halobaculum gomorrense]|uniref:DUF7575 domain-containing protein n=1 Tax=Halobaculum gomorrense TaxID=43928 RepID=A0A1M5KTR0_9EURY|nr:hypothetical protein [Halobaculum gomorrense]SHG55533.1 hypothetical protein SAMN05443636_0621 [Halobaculum gomorrense]
MQRRPVVAAALAVVPALGHAYLRRWGRGLAWLSLLAGSGLVFAGLFGVGIGDAATPQSGTGAAPAVAQFAVPVAVVLTLSAVDAYALARRDARRGVLSCPRCGHEVDLSLEFCWYCSVEFEYVHHES